jgi:hypothetical protein
VKTYESQWAAAEDGLTRFMSTRNCAKDPSHGPEKYTKTGQCVQCTKVRAKDRQDRLRAILEANRHRTVAE